jgi:hypothetical protein
MTVALGLAREIQAIVGDMAKQVLGLLDGGEGESLRRLFPPAYNPQAQADYAEYEAEYRRLMAGDLMARHREDVEVLLATIDRPSLSDDEAEAWLRALNQFRLVLGTILDVQEDEALIEADDPRAPGFAVYELLNVLQGALLEELAPDR